jgi:hypothetical protein
MKCSNCGHENRSGVKFCEECGQLIKSDKGISCPECGFKNRAGVNFCENCGATLEQASTVQPVPVMAAEPKREKEKKGLHPLIWVLGGVFAAFILLLLGFFLGAIRVPLPPQPETSVLPEFVVSAWNGAYNYQTTGAFDTANPVNVVNVTTANNRNGQAQVQTGECKRMVTKAECEQGGGTWGGFLTEKYCICKSDPQDPVKRDKTWCVEQGGTWTVNKFAGTEGCTFFDPYLYYKDEKTCEENGGVWNGLICDHPFGTMPWLNKYPINSCSITDKITVGEIIFNPGVNPTGGGQFEVEISQPEDFPDGSHFEIFPTDQSKEYDGYFDCNISKGPNTLLCIKYMGPWYPTTKFEEANKIYETYLGKDLSICRDVYCCVNVGKAKIKKPEGTLLGLAGNCPLSGDISTNITEWKSNLMTMEITNKMGWSASSMSTDLTLGNGVHWTTLDCSRKPDNDQVMNCKGTAFGKTGTYSMSFNYGGQTCSITGRNYEIPCLTAKCQGTCCPPGYKCCSCGCRLAGSDCSSVCS